METPVPNSQSNPIQSNPVYKFAKFLVLSLEREHWPNVNTLLENLLETCNYNCWQLAGLWQLRVGIMILPTSQLPTNWDLDTINQTANERNNHQSANQVTNQPANQLFNQPTSQTTDLLPLIVGIKIGVLSSNHSICITLLRCVPENRVERAGKY